MMEVAAFLLILAPVASWITAWILVRAAVVKPHLRFLTFVAIVVCVGSLGGSLLAPLAIDVLLPGRLVYQPWVSVLLVGGVLALSATGPIFLALYLVGFFERER